LKFFAVYIKAGTGLLVNVVINN